ncbi:TrmH family RNA methyltransferase [Streptococcus sp. CSL10205-OR2]|uniref:TrmH family RNA methyltransferase n=1 Tax=Streptococcus sp. CSL10205-OR2 TaxID=2980558 RepID=UPI0021D8A395|nr:RNA methyltransferase [Streptococcus sp. CSL10205-OR2]MCU9534216.1 RNA methyltransferase [Streptococcus sp. CSL10205-OR2]
MTIITSKTNNLIKKTKKLLQKKHRQNSYLIEGWHLLEEAIKYKATILNIFVIDSQKERVPQVAPIIVVSEAVLKELTLSKAPQGVIAEIKMSVNPPLKKQGRYLILEDVQDPGNVGTMIRTADAANFDGVFVSLKTADIYNDKTLRSMQGSHFHLPIYRLEMTEIIKQLKEQMIPLIATSLRKESINYKNLAKYDAFALVMGNEGQGISDLVAKEADFVVHITMPGQAESLNVSVAAGIIIFQLI